MKSLPNLSPRWGASFFAIILLLSTGSFTLAAIVSDVRATKHNLSASADGSSTPSGGTIPARTVKATSETQVCVFCHTPHGATGGINVPLWNRALSAAIYTPYLSSSIDANPPPSDIPGAGSKVCLSCHDGTMAIGTVNVLNGVSNFSVGMAGTGVGDVMPNGPGASSGFTRNLGIDLGNDHPISFIYDGALGGISGKDGELRTPGTTIVGNSARGAVKPTYPLQGNQVQCPTCHDPHLNDTVITNPPLKFLRGHRLQQVNPAGGNYVASEDIMCLACHDKAGTTWSNSAHANELIANQTYLLDSATQREFPVDTPVWKASCNNCHDSHSVQGSRHLLVEGTDNGGTPKIGGNSAIEQTCFQCHSGIGTSIITPLATVPDIKSDFALAIRMPISNADQGVSVEAHDIGGNFNDSSTTGDSNAHCDIAIDRCGKDFVESQAVLGRVALARPDLLKRHAECTDCHNPHRTSKTRLFNDLPPGSPAEVAPAGTHKHAVIEGTATIHTNIVSGALRGTFGVEPIFSGASSNEFGANPSGFTVKRGDGGVGASAVVSSTWVTREYQICFKCHSNFAYDTQPDPPTTVVTPPLSLGSYGGSTGYGTNGMFFYTDVAMESQAPASHQGASAPGDSGASAGFTANNQRSWHPVMEATGRTTAVRNADPNLWRAPWNGSDIDGPPTNPINTIHVAAVGNQTMYCSDCHGSGNTLADGSDPVNGEDGNSWGPHGSGYNFLLKGPWNTSSSVGVASDILCFRCHDATQYADASGAAPTMSSGFGHATNLDPLDGTTPLLNQHQRHAYYATLAPATVPSWPVGVGYRCTLCHTGTAHGWKNKGFLVNLDDLGLELNGPGADNGLAGIGGAIGGELPPGAAPALLINEPVPKGTKAASVPYTNGPYYQGAYLRVTQFAASGNWLKTDCTGGCH